MPTALPALAVRGELGSERHEQLGDDREQPDQRRRPDQDPERRRRGGDEQDERGSGEHAGHDALAVQQVAGGHDQGQSDGVPDLRAGDDQSGGGLAGVEVVGDRVQQRLGVVEVRGGDARRRREQPEQLWRERGADVRRC